jgi:hypothetical protein
MGRRRSIAAANARARRAGRRLRLDRFADLVAEGASVAAAGRAIGLAAPAAAQAFAAIRRRLGVQAR